MYCKECNNKIPDEAFFCPICGAQLQSDLQETGLLTEDDVKVNDFYSENDELETGLLMEDADPATELLTENKSESSADSYAYAKDNNPVNVTNMNSINSSYINPGFKQQYPSGQFIPNSYQQPYQVPQELNQNLQSNRKMTYVEYFDQFASRKTKNYSKTLGIICIITAIASIGFFGLMGNPLSIVDAVFYLVFGILILKMKKWGFSLPICIYGGIFTILGLVVSGTPSGIFAFVVSIIATVQMKKVDDAYKNYLYTNQIPQTKI